MVAEALAISRSSLYYRKKPRGSRAERTHDEQIVAACGEKPAYGYRRVTWWLRRKEGLRVNRKRVLLDRLMASASATTVAVNPRSTSTLAWE